MNQLLWALLSVALAGVPAVAQAQAYPTKPIRLIVTFAAGGGTDLAARAVAPKLAEALGQPVVVENRAGANGAVGAEATAKSPADGYTLMVGAAGTLAVAPHLNAKLPFDPFKDFAPVSLLATSAFVVSVNPSVKAQSIRELVALAKASPGSLTFGSSGTGGAPQLAGELFKSQGGVNLLHVPYKGLGPAITDLLGGQIQVVFADVGLVTAHLKAGRLRGLAITSATRSSMLPDLPTVSESGVPGYAAGTWYGVFAPAGTPGAIVARLSEEVRRALALPEVRAALVAQGVEAAGNSPEQYAAFLREEYAKWGRVIAEAGIRAE
ncbi:MAG: tripartite tricarboxylate transporter substrate binding protein [Betaproteobacteria bacterium]